MMLRLPFAASIAYLAPLREARLVQRPRQAAQLLAPALQQPPAHSLCTVDMLVRMTDCIFDGHTAVKAIVLIAWSSKHAARVRIDRDAVCMFYKAEPPLCVTVPCLDRSRSAELRSEVSMGHSTALTFQQSMYGCACERLPLTSASASSSCIPCRGARTGASAASSANPHEAAFKTHAFFCWLEEPASAQQGICIRCCSGMTTEA